MLFHHLGIATKNIHKSSDFINCNFNIKDETEIIFDKEQNASLKLIHTDDMTYELVSGEQVKDIVKNNITYYHVCYEVDTFYELLNIKDIMLVTVPKKAVLFDNRRVVFAMTPLGLMEFLEK